MSDRRMVKDHVETIVNKSSLFFLPMLGEFKYEFRNLRGVFVWNEEFPEYDKHIFLLFKNSDTKEFKENLERLMSFSNFIASYKPDKFHTLLVFLPPKELEKDYELLKDSKYSKISQTYKRHIFKFHNIRNNSDEKAVQAILYKDPTYREYLMDKLGAFIPEDQELASKLRETNFWDGEEWITGETYLNEMKVQTNVINGI